MILIGSRALVFRSPFILSRQPKDFDFIGEEHEVLEWLEKHNLKNYKYENGKIIVDEEMCEFELVEKGKSNELFVQLVENDPQTIKTDFGLVPSLDLLFALKKSHRFLKNSPHVWKTLTDYHRMKKIGAVVRPEHEEFFKLREKETYSYKHPRLNQNKKDFFAGDGVHYVFDHDSLHESQKHLDMPAYKYYAADNEEVKSDKNKFFACSEEIRRYGVLEECSVLALERSIIPFFPNPSVEQLKRSWMMAFSKVITSITSGFFRAYAYENAFEILKFYPSDYYEKFQKGVSSGVVRYINNNEQIQTAM